MNVILNIIGIDIIYGSAYLTKTHGPKNTVPININTSNKGKNAIFVFEPIALNKQKSKIQKYIAREQRINRNGFF